MRDDPIATEHALQQVLIEMIPTPGQANSKGDVSFVLCLLSFYVGFPFFFATLTLMKIFKLQAASRDMVLPQLDAYHSGRQLQHLQPWVSVELAQQQSRGQPGVLLNATYQYEAYAGFHVIQLLTDGAPILLFSDPTAIRQFSPWDLCCGW